MRFARYIRTGLYSSATLVISVMMGAVDYLALLDAGKTNTADNHKEHEVSQERLGLGGRHRKGNNRGEHLTRSDLGGIRPQLKRSTAIPARKP
jgi:hypothetical protein